MNKRLAASIAFALSTAALGAGCSAGPTPDEASGRTSEADSTCTAPFRAEVCTTNDDETHPRVHCGCLAVTGAPASTGIDVCGASVPPPAGLEDCTVGEVINQARLWVCPDGTTLPQGFTAAPPFTSNCVGAAKPGWFFVTDAPLIGPCPPPVGNQPLPPYCDSQNGCSGPCDAY